MRAIINSQGGMVFHRLPEGVQNITASRYSLEQLEEIMQHTACILLLEGGADIQPSIYGEVNTYSHCHPDRDIQETALYHLARKNNVPILGLCRGHQLMAALAGGKLYQDIAREVGRGHHPTHSILFPVVATLTGFTALMESCPLGKPDVVNSYHHQAVKVLPPNAIELAVSASDGVNEAILYPWGLSVQWHPEFLDHTEFVTWMFDNFKVNNDHTADNNGRGARVSSIGDRSDDCLRKVVTLPSA